MVRYAGLAAILLMAAAATLVAQQADKEKLIESIIRAETNGENMIRQAAGTAIVNKSFKVIERSGQAGKSKEGDPREGAFSYIADFKLKGDLQRVTKYSYDASTGTRGERKEDRIWESETYWQYMPSANCAEHKETSRSPFVRALGESFSMDVFKSVGGSPFASLMRSSLRDSDHWETTVSEDGMMVIRCGFSTATEKKPKWEMELVLNPGADYSIMELNHKWESQEGASGEKQYKADWEKKGDVWVPKHVSRRVVYRPDPNDATAAGDTEEKCDVEITTFDPAAEVPDSVFTVEDLNMPAGTGIMDVVANLSYTYKGAATEEKALKDISKDISEDLSKVAPPVSTSPVSVPPGPNTDSESAVEAGGLSTAAIWAISVFCAVCVTSAVVVALRLRARK